MSYKELLEDNSRPLVVLFTGAGMSADSGLPTYRDNDGLWENYEVMKVATANAWQENPENVMGFHNLIRAKLENAKPNAGHLALAKLETKFRVIIITQNVDNLHERAGSSNVIHLHGELTKVKSEIDEEYVQDIGYKPINMGDLCPKGGQMRPDVVWFDEEVRLFPIAEYIASLADIFIVIGTSLKVYPAATLARAPKRAKSKMCIDKIIPEFEGMQEYICYKETAAEGTPKVVDILLESV